MIGKQMICQSFFYAYRSNYLNNQSKTSLKDYFVWKYEIFPLSLQHLKNLNMATSIKLSKITKVDLRDCWQNEASDFTPWLASEENIALLADALGMNELEVKAQEEHVGPFRADILCVDPGTDRII